MRRYTVGEDPRTEGSRGKEIGLSWNGPISPTIQGRVKKAEYSHPCPEEVLVGCWIVHCFVG
jgi:hypothetical protein